MPSEGPQYRNILKVEKHHKKSKSKDHRHKRRNIPHRNEEQYVAEHRLRQLFTGIKNNAEQGKS